MSSLSLMTLMLHRAAARLRAELGGRWRLGPFVAISLCFSVLPALFQSFEPGDVVGLLAPWALLLAPRRPWACTAVLVPSVVFSIASTLGAGTVIAAWLALLVLLRARRYPQVLAIAAAAAAGNLLAWRMGRDMTAVLVTQGAWFVVCLGAAVVLRSADASVARAETARTEALRNQRALIARELHDTLARANTHILLLAQHAQANPDNHAQTATALDNIITTAHQSVTDLRTMLRLLRQDTGTAPDPTPTTDLTTALTQAQHDLEAAGLHATITHDGDTTHLPPALTTTLIRILHESVANMIKHAAHDAQCTIQLDITTTHAELLAINPLADHHTHNHHLSSGLGLLSIQECVHALAGTTTITPTDHQWILHTTLPLTPNTTNTTDDPDDIDNTDKDTP